jgi:hypothetical protein
VKRFEVELAKIISSRSLENPLGPDDVPAEALETGSEDLRCGECKPQNHNIVLLLLTELHLNFCIFPNNTQKKQMSSEGHIDANYATGGFLNPGSVIKNMFSQDACSLIP